MEECTGQDWAADFWPLTTGVSTDTFSNIVGTSTTSSTLHHHDGYGQEQATFNPHYIMHHETQQQPVRAVGTGLTLGRLDLLGQKVVAASSSTSTASTVNSNTPQPSPSTGMSSETKRRGSDTARKDRSNVLKAYLMDVGCTKIRGARKRRKNDDGEYEGGKLDWDSEWVQEVRQKSAFWPHVSVKHVLLKPQDASHVLYVLTHSNLSFRWKNSPPFAWTMSVVQGRRNSRMQRTYSKYPCSSQTTCLNVPILGLLKATVSFPPA